MRYLGLGFIAGVTWLYVLAQIAVRPWLLFAIAIAAMFAAIAVWRYAARNSANLAIGFAAASVVGAAGAIYMAATVMNQAEASASGRPFCIQVASPSDYSPARSFLDLSPLTMHATTSSGRSMTHHAILVVQNTSGAKLFHWSYHKRRFVAGTIDQAMPEYGPAIVCEPEKDFAQRLPLLFASHNGNIFVRFSDREAYRIPLTYQPRWSGGQNRYLTFHAAPPDFAASSLRDTVIIQWKSHWLTSLIAARARGEHVEQGRAYGLTSQIYTASDKSLLRQRRYFTNPADPLDGANITLIECPSDVPNAAASAKTCQHHFLNAGRHVTFRHSPDDVPRWRELQQKLVALLASFEASAVVPTPPSSRP